MRWSSWIHPSRIGQVFETVEEEIMQFPAILPTKASSISLLGMSE
jgi:hypothetical protein